MIAPLLTKGEHFRGQSRVGRCRRTEQVGVMAITSSVIELSESPLLGALCLSLQPVALNGDQRLQSADGSLERSSLVRFVSHLAMLMHSACVGPPDSA